MEMQSCFVVVFPSKAG